MAQRLPSDIVVRYRPLLWLAAVDGRRLSHPFGSVVAPIGAPETPLEIEFEGISEAQQRTALAAFPGGRRFVLKPPPR